MTKVQFEKALLLAKRFGHEWARHQEVRYLLKSERLAPTTELVAAIVAARVEHLQQVGCENQARMMNGGIDAPNCDGWLVTHTTQTGRVRWEIIPDGEVSIYVNRPGQAEIICISIYPGGEVVAPNRKESLVPGELTHMYAHWEAGKVWVWTEHLPMVHTRHVAAAEEAVAALVGKKAAELALSGLAAMAKPDPAPPAEEDVAPPSGTEEDDSGGEEIPEYTLLNLPTKP